MKIIKKIIRAILFRTNHRYHLISEKAGQVYYSLFGSKVECNICHYKANILNSDSWHQFSVCPNCGNGVRQRLLWATLTSTKDWNIDKIIKNRAVLHFAPEKALSGLIEPVAQKYKTADLLAEGYTYPDIDYNMDISDMHQLQDMEYDCIIACDVLEHVYDDKKALREVHRVLSKGGHCIFTVPQKDNLEKTYEDLAVTDPKEREEKFGQIDHLRIYGNDFVQAMNAAGFDTIEVDENNFDKKQQVKNVLFPPVLSNHPLATNYRKIFIGHKS
ncbi:MAG: methyltransferase domain-containing protein [Ferruginibacter sp.]